jgi:Tol biopolymer transport system component
VFTVQRPSGSELRIANMASNQSAYDLGGVTRTGGGPEDWSSDGVSLFLSKDDPQTLLDLWLIKISTDEPRSIAEWTPWAVERGNERHGRFSPDGKLAAYTSDISGREEVYVKFLDNRGGSARWQVSAAGGTFPAWTERGPEIVYLSPDDHLMSAKVRVELDEVILDRPVALFKAEVLSQTPRQCPFAVLPGGRFLLNRRVDHDTPPIGFLFRAVR